MTNITYKVISQIKIKKGCIIALKVPYKITNRVVNYPLVIYSLNKHTFTGFPVFIDEDKHEVIDLIPQLFTFSKNNILAKYGYLDLLDLLDLSKDVYQDLLYRSYYSNPLFLEEINKSLQVANKDIIFYLDSTKLHRYFVLNILPNHYQVVELNDLNQVISSKITYLSKDIYLYDVQKIKSLTKKKILKQTKDLKDSNLVGKVIYYNHQYLDVLLLAHDYFIAISATSSENLIHQIPLNTDVEVIGELEPSIYQEKLILINQALKNLKATNSLIKKL